MQSDVNRVPDVVECQRERIDEKRHVVVRRLHDGVLGGPAVAFDRRVEDANLGRPRSTAHRPFEMSKSGGGKHARVAFDLLELCLRVVAREESLAVDLRNALELHFRARRCNRFEGFRPALFFCVGLPTCHALPLRCAVTRVAVRACRRPARLDHSTILANPARSCGQLEVYPEAPDSARNGRNLGYSSATAAASSGRGRIQ